jgi:hypothetical protein
MTDVESWRRRGDAARLAHAAVNSAFRAHVREREPDRYAALLKDFREKTAAALPSSDAAFMPGLAKGHVRCIETAIAFLDADPWFFRSGYEKQNIIRHLKRVPLSEAQRLRLARVVLAAIDGHAAGVPESHAGGVREKGHRVEFRNFGRLACGIWSAFLDAEVARRMQSPDPGIRRRATWVAAAAISAGRA